MLPILHQSYWRDEAFSVLLASKNLKEILLLTIKDVHPPLYYFLLHFWIKLFGDFEYVTRSLSLLFFLLLVLSSFFLIKHFLKDWKISLLGSLAILLNPFLIEYAFETRAYIFLAFLIVTSTLFYLKKKHLLFTLFLALSLLTHNFAIFFLGSFIAFWFYENRENLIKKMGQFILLFSFPILIFIVWMNFLWNQWVKVTEGFWIGQKTSAVIVETFRAYFQGVGNYPSTAMFYNLSIILVFFGLAYWVVRIVNKDKDSLNKDNFLLIFLFSIPFLITYLISAFWTPIFHERFLIPILPLFIIWIIYSLFKLFDLNKSLSYLIFALALAYIFFGIQSSEEIMRKNTKPSINYAVKQVLAISGDEDIIIPENNLNFLETKYYVKHQGRNNPVYAYSQEG
ncbi:MAG: glycosyltransferase family 39 protein, partial [Thermodesulfovibrionales bacterium]